MTALAPMDTAQYRRAYDQFVTLSPLKHQPSFMHAARARGMERFEKLGFPTTKHEEWKYTNIVPLTTIPFAPEPIRSSSGIHAGDISSLLPAGEKASRNVIVFVDGTYAPDLSRLGNADGVTLAGIAEALAKGGTLASRIEEHLGWHAPTDSNAFAALNTAFLNDGAYVHVSSKASVDDPICILHVATATSGGRVTHPRTLIVVGEQARATIIESYASLADAQAPAFVNAATEVVAAADSNVDHYLIQTNEPHSYHIGATQVVLARGAHFSTHTITIGTRFCRNTAGATLNGRDIECTMNGLYFVSGDQLVDNHTSIDHAQPHCDSHELYKGILDGRSRAVFNGKVFVRKDAQKTDAKQTNRNLILSDDAIVDTKPQLEIFADDVKCTHGATIGQLDENALFYLQSRGIGEEAARSLLTYGFADDVLKRIKVKSLRETLERALFEGLRSRFGAVLAEIETN
mgnify:CR=1 FL=1